MNIFVLCIYVYDSYAALICSLKYTKIAIATRIFWPNNIVAEFSTTEQSPVLGCGLCCYLQRPRGMNACSSNQPESLWNVHLECLWLDCGDALCWLQIISVCSISAAYFTWIVQLRWSCVVKIHPNTQIKSPPALTWQPACCPAKQSFQSKNLLPLLNTAMSNGFQTVW